MGVVYLVQNRETPGPVVLKTYQQPLGADVKKQFISEAHAWINAGVHANIVQAYWVREIASQLFVCAEYIRPDDGGRNTLTHFIEAGALRTELVLLWASQFCYGILNYIGGYKRALEFLGPYIKHNPDNDALLVVRSEIHEYRDNFNAAIQDLRKAKSILAKRKGPEVAANMHFIDQKLNNIVCNENKD